MFCRTVHAVCADKPVIKVIQTKTMPKGPSPCDGPYPYWEVIGDGDHDDAPNNPDEAVGEVAQRHGSEILPITIQRAENRESSLGADNGWQQHGKFPICEDFSEPLRFVL